MYEQLIKDISSGTSKFYFKQGDLFIRLEIKQINSIRFNDEAKNEIGKEIILAEDNTVSVYKDDLVSKVTRVPNVLNRFEFCYLIRGLDSDYTFYIGKLA